MKKIKRLTAVILSMMLVISLSGCELLDSKINDLKGSITGNTYTIEFFTNTGDLFCTTKGEKIDLESNVVEEPTYNSSDGWGKTQTLSSVVSIHIDGKEMETCGSTAIFTESGLKKDADFTTIDKIDSNASGVTSNTIISKTLNKYKNAFGKARVVLIQSQLGDPICAYSGNKVYYEVCEDLPKTTKIMIDGKALYIHRANFQIIDKSLIK